MKLASSVSVLSILFYLYENVKSFHLQAEIRNEVLCDDVDLIKFIDFPHNHKCLQVVVNGNSEVNCMLKLIGQNFILVKIRSFMALKYRDISAETQENCQMFFIIAESIIDATEIFELDPESDKHQFLPFSKIYFHILNERFNGSKTTNIDSMAVMREFFTRNALFGYMFEVTKSKIESKHQVSIRDLLTNELKRPTSSYTPSDLLHPMVDTRLAKDNFRISLFNCKPFAIYTEDASDKT